MHISVCISMPFGFISLCHMRFCMAFGSFVCYTSQLQSQSSDHIQSCYFHTTNHTRVCLAKPFFRYRRTKHIVARYNFDFFSVPFYFTVFTVFLLLLRRTTFSLICRRFIPYQFDFCVTIDHFVSYRDIFLDYHSVYHRCVNVGYLKKETVVE